MIYKRFFDEGTDNGTGATPDPKADPKPDPKPETQTIEKTYFQGFTAEMVEKLEAAKEAEFSKKLETYKKEWELEYNTKRETEAKEKARLSLLEEVGKDENVKTKFELYGFDVNELDSDTIQKFIKMWNTEKGSKTATPEGNRIDNEKSDLSISSLTEAFKKKLGGK